MACPGAADAMNKIVNAAVDGKKTPNINAKVFSNASDDLGEFTEVLVEGNKLKMYKNGQLVDVDPKDVKTIRAFAKDAQGRRVHSFVASQEKGQEAVSSFFKNIDSGKISPQDAKALGNNFQKMSEADQATLVGGIENKLRRGEQITEAEFLIAVKGTPGFRTVPGPPPHLADIQKAFRSGNLDESIDILSKSWKVHDASTETQGRVARIAKLLADNKGNRPVSVLTDLGSSGKLPAKAGGAIDDINPPTIIPGKSVAPTQTKTPALGKPPETGVAPYVHKSQIMPKENPVEVFIPKPKLESPAIDGKFTVVDDPALILKADAAKPVGVKVPPKLVAPEPPKLLPAPKAPVAPVAPKPKVIPSDNSVFIVTPKGVVFKPTLKNRFINWVKTNKIKSTLIGGATGAVIMGSILELCKKAKEYNPSCWDYYFNLFDETDEDIKDKFKGAKIRMERVTEDDKSIACHWKIDLKDPDSDEYRALDANLIQSLSTGDDKMFEFKWTGIDLPETPADAKESVLDNVNSRLEDSSKGVTCYGEDKSPDNPCILPAPYALNKEVNIQMPAILVDSEGKTIDTNAQCNNQNNNGVVPKPVPTVIPTPGATPAVTPTPTSTPEPEEEEKEEDECETTDTDSDLPWYEAEKENCEKPPAQRVIDPFNILQGNDGVKQPLVPPQPIVVPPSNFPPYVTPGYY